MTYNPQAPYTNDETAQPSSWLSMLTGATVVGGIVAALVYGGNNDAFQTFLKEKGWTGVAAAASDSSKWLSDQGTVVSTYLNEHVVPDGLKATINGKTVAAVAAAAVGGIVGLALKPHHVDEAAGHALPHALAHMTNGNIPTV